MRFLTLALAAIISVLAIASIVLAYREDSRETREDRYIAREFARQNAERAQRRRGQRKWN